MSLNFTAGQFEGAYLPKRLSNWETSYRESRAARGAQSRIGALADEHGRLLRRPQQLDYRRQVPLQLLTAWDYPKRITQQAAENLRKSYPLERSKTWHSSNRETTNKIAENSAIGTDIKVEDVGNNVVEDYKPGDLTDPKDKIVDDDLIEHLDLTQLKDEIDEAKAEESHPRRDMKGENSIKNGKNQLPIIDPSPGFNYARKMHMDNLLHHPLPDALSMKQSGVRLYQELDVKPYSLAFNSEQWRRPMTSTNVKKQENPSQMRPLTSGCCTAKLSAKKQQISPMDLAICWDLRTLDPRDEPKRSKHIDGSNGSLAPAVFSMVHTPKKVVNGVPETGRSDAIFSQNIQQHDYEEGRVIPSFEKDMSKNRNKNSCDVPKCPQHSMYDEKKHTKQSKQECDGIHGCGTESQSSKMSKKSDSSTTKRKLDKNVWDVCCNNESKENIEGKRNNSIDRINNNSPCSSQSKDKSKNSPVSSNKHETISSNTDCSKGSKKKQNRNCKACHENCKKKSNDNHKTNYKAAFKAGNPNSIGSSDSTNTTKNSVKVPKMREPYSKKTYAIPTLHPPFSRWNDTSGYPEHWRLASVYQHAYKTPGPKRRPLLPSVYQ